MLKQPKLNRHAQRLARYLRRTGQSQRAFAAQMGLSEYTVCRWLTGRNRISPGYQRLLELLGVLTP